MRKIYILSWIVVWANSVEMSSLSTLKFDFILITIIEHFFTACSHGAHPHTHTHQLALTCPLSSYSLVTGFCISLSNHLLSPRGPKRPSVRPVSYEVRSVFITSVKAAVIFALSSQLLWRAATVFSNLNIISLTCSDNAASWSDTAVYHSGVTAWPKHCQATSKVLSHATPTKL